MHDPVFWTVYLLGAFITWALCSRFLVRSMISGYDALGVWLLWPMYVVLLFWCACKGMCKE